MKTTLLSVIISLTISTLALANCHSITGNYFFSKKSHACSGDVSQFLTPYENEGLDVFGLVIKPATSMIIHQKGCNYNSISTDIPMTTSANPFDKISGMDTNEENILDSANNFEEEMEGYAVKYNRLNIQTEYWTKTAGSNGHAPTFPGHDKYIQKIRKTLTGDLKITLIKKTKNGILPGMWYTESMTCLFTKN
jgi:hypothetical protein